MQQLSLINRRVNAKLKYKLIVRIYFSIEFAGLIFYPKYIKLSSIL